MILTADKLILCGTCGARIGLMSKGIGNAIAALMGGDTSGIGAVTLMKDRYIVHDGNCETFYCNEKCKAKANV